MSTTIINNPFVDCTARDMKYEEVNKYWCNSFRLYKLNEGEFYSSKTPIIIEGARGTGKTMMLKYLSYSVQKCFADSSDRQHLLEHYRKVGLGIYFRYKADFCNLFDELNCDNEQKDLLFKMYFQLFLLREYVSILEDIYDSSDELANRCVSIICSVINYETNSFKDIKEYINNTIFDIDRAVNDSIYNENWFKCIGEKIEYTEVMYKTIYEIQRKCNELKDVYIVILLDEYENAFKFHKIINTYVKQSDDSLKLTYRIGMRPDGMDYNNATNVAGEKLQVDRDFLLRRLVYDNLNQYKEFAYEVASRRLNNTVEYRENGLTDIEKLLGKKEDLDDEAERIADSDKQFGIIEHKFSDSELKRVKRTIGSNEKLLEMYNILRVLRGDKYEEIGKISRQYVEQRDNKNLKSVKGNVRKYMLDYSSKYRMALLYLLLAIYKNKNKEYYSFNTFIYLSSGAINDFISLCRNTFRYVDRDVFKDLCNGGRISNDIQTIGAKITAKDQYKKLSMSNKYGFEMATFVDNMGNLFREYHRDPKVRYPETNQFAFLNEAGIIQNERLALYLHELVNSGAVIKTSEKHRITIGKRRGNIYKLNRIFAPEYQYSYRTRGGFNYTLTENEFDILLHESIDAKDMIKHEDFNQMKIEL